MQCTVAGPGVFLLNDEVLLMRAVWQKNSPHLVILNFLKSAVDQS